MSTINKVILIGNVGSDPEIRYLDHGVVIGNVSLATTERGYTMQNGTQVPDRTEWHAIVLWKNLAEWAEKYVKKGMKLYVEGKLQTRSWEKEGIRKSKTEVIAENVQILYRPDYLRNNINNNGTQATATTTPAESEQKAESSEEKESFDFSLTAE